MLDFERKARQEGHVFVAGVDEAGRGPLAGPVVAAAVIFSDLTRFDGIDDSKKMTEKQRAAQFDLIRDKALAYGVGIVDAPTIDRINILQASRLAMKIAVEQMERVPDLLLIDGNQKIEVGLAQRTVIKGDSLSQSIAAASILAKVIRDRMMARYDATYPGYEFKRHKGYGTALHRERIRQLGPCVLHRKSFKGVKEFL
ncbi:MAG: ribonuclease HII [Candidatus Nitrohelix vancouverensis]|uniref:Ribonuclease HII n=1 Tax=Candidatus Nitrohelix vancouverensis TaxID=2705534 RepID=A0A7T0C558_9BACT|nr:MAG: ribonuclease HII [Candidatus Nitrohelix vancouverensis]